MFKDEKLKKKIVYIVTISLLFLIIYIIGCKCYYGDIYFLGGNNNKHIWEIEDLQTVSKDFQVQDDGSFVSTSPDPWFDIQESFPVRTILIDVKSISKTHDSQIFYYLSNQSLDEERSYYFRLKKGINYIQIPEGEFNMFRLDLTDTEDINLKIESITTYGNRLVSSMFLFLIIGIWAFISKSFYNFLFNKKSLQFLKDELGEYKYYQILMLILISITTACVYGYLIKSGNQYVYYDIGGGDEPEAYIPLYFYYIKKIAVGEISPWTFNNGLGTSTLSVSGYVFNPFILLVYIVGLLFGVSTINNMLLIVQVLNIFVCGILCYKYLSKFNASFFANSVASYIFAFNGFMILFCQHYIFMQFPLYTLIILMLIEKAIESKKINRYHFMLSIVCMLIFCCSIYMGYMIGLFSAIYATIRLCMTHERKEFKFAIKELFIMFGFAILGIMLAMPLVIPMAMELLFNSNRIISDSVSLFDKLKSFLVEPYSLDALETIFLRLLSNNFQGAGNDYVGVTGNSINDYYAPPTLFFSVFFLVFVIVYFATLRKRAKNKKIFIIQCVIGILVLFLLFNRLGSATFNAFVDIFGRYSFILMPVFAIMVSIAIDEMLKLTGKRNYIVVAAAFITVAILVRQYSIAASRPEIGYLSVLLLIDIVAVIFMMILFYLLSRKPYTFARVVIVLLLFTNIIAESFVTVNNRAFCLFSADLLNEDDVYTQDALDFINNKDDSMYRVEKNYYDLIYFHDAYFQNYRGISTYNATLNKNVKEFYREYCNTGINFYGFDSFWYSFMNVSNDIVQNTVLGIRYIISNGLEYSDNMYTKLYENDGAIVYENNASSSFGIFYDNIIAKSDLNGKDMIDKTSVLQNAIVVEDSYAETENNVSTYENVMTQLNEQECFNMQSPYDIYANGTTIYEINANEIVAYAEEIPEIELFFRENITHEGENSFLEFYSNIDYSDEIRIYFDNGLGYENLKEYYLRGNVYGEWQGAKILLPIDTKSIKIIGSCPSFAIKDLRVVTSNEPIVPNDVEIYTNLEKDNIVSGTINNNRTGYLFLPIPYEEGWSAFVDGQEVDIIQADSGFMAIKLEVGQHSFELKYQYRYFSIGVLCMLMGIGILLYLYMHMKTKHVPVLIGIK